MKSIPQAVLTLLIRPQAKPFTIAPSMLESLAVYTQANGLINLFRLLGEYSVRVLDAEKAPGRLLTSEQLSLVKTLLHCCARHPTSYNDLMFGLLNILLFETTLVDVPNYLQYLKDLPPLALSGTMSLLLDQPNVVELLPLLDALSAAILTRSQESSKQNDRHPHQNGTWLLYRYLALLIDVDQRRQALLLFQQLIHNDHFPSTAITGTSSFNPSELGDSQAAFDITILSVMCRACQLYGWVGRTLLISKKLIAICSDEASDAKITVISRVLHNVISELIAEGRPAPLDNAVHLFRACLNHENVLSFPAQILNELYTALNKASMYDAMGALVLDIHRDYSGSEIEARAPPTPSLDHSEEPRPRRSSQIPPPYRPPSGKAALGLLNHEHVRRRDPSIARIIAAHHVGAMKEFFARDAYFVPGFIKAYARVGLISEAVELWNAFLKEPGAEMLVGNAQSVISLVKALVHKADSVLASSRQFASSGPQGYQTQIGMATASADGSRFGTSGAEWICSSRCN
jgi:hypothetical protein